MSWHHSEKSSLLIFNRLAILAVVVVIAGCSSAPPLPPPPAQPHYNDHLVVPGKRIGSVSIGMTAKQVLDVMGSPLQTYRFTDGANYRYSGNFYVLVDDATQQVWRAAIEDYSYQTKEGFGVGQTELEMRAKLGNPDSSTNIGNGFPPTYRYCYKNGLAVYTAPDGKIWRLSIFNPGATCD